VHQTDVVENGNPHPAEVGTSGFLEEVIVLGAEDVRFADYGGLHHDDVVYVADGRDYERVQDHKFRGSAEEIDVVEDQVLWQGS
jgi:hypothetical protein